MSEESLSPEELPIASRDPYLASSNVPTQAPLSPHPSIPTARAGALRYERVLGRLTKVEIENYRGFSGRFTLDLSDGCNLLVYGENGVGKSSLFQTLRDFLEGPDRRFYDEKLKRERPLKCDDHRHRFNSDPASVRLSFSAPPAAMGVAANISTYEWSASKDDPRTPVMRIVDNGKGFLDYKSLLRVQLLPKGQKDINLFDIFIDPLLAHYKNPASSPSLTFINEWKRIKLAFEPHVRKPGRLDEWTRDFNSGFERVVKDSVALASRLLADFDKELAVDVEFTPASYSWGPKKLVPPKILAKPSFRRLQSSDYHGFLNEARLSALAIAIYFAGLKESPAADLRLLVLDDILIGLDMANRMTVLRIAERLFPDWQVIVLTYHKPWFEILKARTQYGKWAHPWKGVTFRIGRASDTACPIIVADSSTLLAQAQAHLAHYGDVKAAAVYARSAWEAALSWYCAEMHLPVTYVESRRELDTDAFLCTITRQLGMLRDAKDREWGRAILQEIKHARRFVLNPHAHYDPDLEDEISAEIADGIRAVEDFELLLRCVRKEDFIGPNEEPARARVGEMLHAALEHLGIKRHTAALDALSRAFEQHLDEFFQLREEMIPYGIKVNRMFLFTWAGHRHLFPRLTWTLLRRADLYLLGTVSLKHFDSAAFASAAHLFLRLRVDFLLRRREHELTRSVRK
jgi:hypothetical protein